MKKRIFTWLASGCALACAAAEPSFALIRSGNFANGELVKSASGGLVMKMRTVADPKNNWLAAYADLRQEISAQKKLMFRFRGAPEFGAGAHLTPAIAYTAPGEKQWRSALAGSIPLTNGEFRSCTLGFDTDFKLADSGYTLRQIKFVINGGALPPGTAMEVSIDDIRVGDAGEGGSGSISVLPPPIPVRKDAGRRIFFELENDDHSSGIPSRFPEKPLKEGEPRVPAGFSDLILENTEGIFAETDSIGEADVIVYARVTPGNRGRAVADALKAGKRVIAAGAIPDAELRELSPLELAPEPAGGLPKRQSLRQAEDSMFANVSWNDGARFAEYFAATPRPGAKTLLAFQDGTPFLAVRDNFYHFAGTLGQTVEKSDLFFDRLLLRLCSGNGETAALLDEREKTLLEQRQLRETAAVAAAVAESGISEAEGWRQGASRRNFGRFGWRIGVGLGCGSLQQDLAYANGDQRFRLSTLSGESIPLDAWRLRALDNGVRLPAAAGVMTPWTGEGCVEYTTKTVIPDSWKALRIEFEVAGGIDDTDEFFLNGAPAGKTTTEVPEYWTAPRRYRLDPSQIRFGGENTLRLVVRNLRGGAGVLSPPRLTARRPGSAPVVTVPRLDWTGRICRVSDNNRTFEVHQSLVLPMLRHVFNGERKLNLALENIAEYAAWTDASGKTVVLRLADAPAEFYRLERDGAWGAPWLLLFRAGDSKPLLLVFDRQIQSLEKVVRNGGISALRIGVGDGKNTVIAGFPFGARPVSGSSWTKSLPEELLKKVTQLTEFSLNWPTSVEEFYRIDRDAGAVELINFFHLEHIPNDWNVGEKKYAFLPPLAAFLAGEGMFVRPSEPCEDFAIPTAFGPTVGVVGKAAVRFRYDLPSERDFQIPGVRSDRENALQNEFFADGIRWSCGGSTPMEAWTPAAPNGVRAGKNIDLFSWTFGLNSAMQGIFSLNAENRGQLEARLRRRFLEPVEQYMYKSVYRHRYEPFSGITYPVLIQSYFKLSTPFVPGSASTVTFGDANEAHSVFMWLIQQLEDFAGQQGLAAANWNFIRYAARYQLSIDDYAFQSGSCRDFGVGAWIDMLNGEFGGMMAFARNARLAGDAAGEDEALYRAARRAVPTLARFRFRKHLDSLEPSLRGKSLQITGFGEEGAKYMLYPAGNFNFLSAMDLYDFSEGFMGTLIQLYRKYVSGENAEHLSRRSFPSLRAAAAFSYPYLPALAIFAGEDVPVSEYAEKTFAGNRRMGDWPGMRRAFEIGSILWRANGRITFTKLRNLDIAEAVYDPETRILTMRYTARENAVLMLTAENPIASLKDNDCMVGVEPGADGAWSLPTAPGEHRVEVMFRR